MFQLVDYEENDRQLWDNYVSSHPDGTCYHLSAWKRAVERAYGHPSYYLMARCAVPMRGGERNKDKIGGLLPIFHLKNFLLGSQLVSLPFCDYGGILGDNEEVAQFLVHKALDLASELDNQIVELRQVKKVSSGRLVSFSHKVRMICEIDGNAEKLWKSLDAKLRSQIRKPEKERLQANIGGMELLDDFYKVFSFNMRDLGSPVHSKTLFRLVMEEFGEVAKLQVVYKDKIPIGCGLIICFRDTVFIPWASTVRQFNRLSPNMLLYWNFIKYAAENGFRKFDFGRCSPSEGTYKFKEQWGAKAVPLYWQYGSPNHVSTVKSPLGKERYASLVSLWKRLPLPLANVIGPHIRRHISL
jgi:FemAB-related protein (PEP-CTERM system-associated)